MGTAEPTKKLLFCNQCRRETNHFLEGAHTRHWQNGSYWEELSHKLWICAGCDFGTMEEEYRDGMGAGEGEEPEDVSCGEYEHEYFPKRKLGVLPVKRFVRLKPKLSGIYSESISCYNSGNLLLCAIGLRSLLEGICDNKKVKGYNLQKKIDNLEYLLPNKNIIRKLHHFRFTGNDAAHRLKALDARNLRLAIEVMEDLLNFLYELDYKASKLPTRRSGKRTATPKRLKPALTTPTNESTKRTVN